MKTTYKQHKSLITTESEIITVHNLLILDESGSMESIYRPSLSGCNETIQSVRAAQFKYENQDQRFSFVTFNSNGIKTKMNDIPIKDVRDLTPDDYNPDNCTPLYDAIGKSCSALEKRISPKDRVLVTIITDGYENASSEYTLAAIQGLTERLRKKGWTFIYMGANQDADEVAAQLNIHNKLTFEATVTGTLDMYRRCNKGQNQFFNKLAKMGRDLVSCEDLDF